MEVPERTFARRDHKVLAPLRVARRHCHRAQNLYFNNIIFFAIDFFSVTRR
jgi:hypothetical protein